MESGPTGGGGDKQNVTDRQTNGMQLYNIYINAHILPSSLSGYLSTFFSQVVLLKAKGVSIFPDVDSHNSSKTCNSIVIISVL
jgi:hypothetical protein